jgi:Phage integrase family
MTAPFVGLQAALSLHTKNWRACLHRPARFSPESARSNSAGYRHAIFLSGDGKIESIVRSWQARLKKVFDLAKVYKAGGNAISHRFRDTFAVELLLAGVPIERVSILLGHQSVRVTEEHYNPWVSSRQEQLEADVASAWKKDPILSQKIIRTNSVHWRKDRSTEMKTNQKEWCPGWESNSHEEKSPEDFKSLAYAHKIQQINGLYFTTVKLCKLMCKPERHP